MNDLKGRLDRAADSFRSSAEGLERTLQRARRRERRRRLAAACLALLLSTGATAFAVHAFRTSSDTVPAGRSQICGGFPATEVGTRGDDLFRGTSRDDVFISNGGIDTVRYSGGSDLICYRSGSPPDVIGSMPHPGVAHGARTVAVVPNIVDQPVQQAERTLIDAGVCLRSVQLLHVGSESTGNAAFVVSQDPSAGSMTDQWSDVHVRAEARPISNRALSRLIGPPSDPTCPPDGVGATATPQPSHPVSVPDVSAMSLKEAGAALDRLGLGISVAREVVSGQPRGTILAQDPAAGAQVAKGTEISLIIAESDAGAPSDVLRLSCAGGQTRVLTPDVQAQPDGLHVVVEQGASDAVYVDLSSPEMEPQTQWSSGNDGLNDEFVRPVAPGRDLAYCGTDGLVSKSHEEAASDVFHVVAPTFVPYQPQCPDTYGGAGHAFGPVDYQNAGGYIRATYPGILDSDVVERAEYPQGTMEAWWRVVRDGSIVAAFEISPNGKGLVLEARACQGSGIQLR